MIAKQAMAEAARRDLLVNNAGFGTTGRLATATLDRQEQILWLHVLAMNRLSRASLQLLRPARGGAIAMVSSVASYVNSDRQRELLCHQGGLRAGLAVQGGGVHGHAPADLGEAADDEEYVQAELKETGGVTLLELRQVRGASL